MACRRSGRLCSRRDRPRPPRFKAAKRLLVRLLKKQGLAPKRIVTDKLRS
ncbi:Mobile element protein (plasmid) [Sinorhizobium alkalisoli]|nr:Mobile element protein [Sinorhizobium alkalisoli]